MIANRTTSVSSAKSVAEIQAMLVAAKATALMIDIENEEPSAISFRLVSNGQPLSFRLPCNWPGVLAALKRERAIPLRMLNEEHARRVTWRIVRDWLRAQLSLIEAGATTLEEVMLPWAILSDGTTLGQTMLTSPNSPLRLTHDKRP